MKNLRIINPLLRIVSWVVNLFFRRAMIVITVFALVGGAALIWHVQRIEASLVESMSLRHAKLYTDALEEFRSLYTSEVVNRLESRDHCCPVNFHSKTI